MKDIKLFNEAINDENTKLNWQVLRAYADTEDNANELLDLNGAIFENNIPEIIETLKVGGVEEFTISSNYSGLIETLAEFEKYGAYMNGLTKVTTNHIDWKTNQLAKVPAIKMIIGK